MVRLSDLIGVKGKPDDGTKPASPTPPAPSPPPPAPSTFRPPTPPSAPPARPAVAAPPAPKFISTLEPYYAKLRLCVKELFTQARAGQPLQLAEASMLTQQLPTLSAGQYDEILMLDESHPDDHYLISHSVHVAFLSHRLSQIMGYTPATAHQLALAGLLVDIGMAGEMEQLVQVPRKLTPEERQRIAQHPANAVELLQQSQELSKDALDAIAAHHVRPDGSGYPKETPATAAMEHAKILAVADVYDALTHARSYRQPINPAQAIKLLIDGVGDRFDRRVVKALVDELSLYPRGSTIKLNTNEVAVVHRVNPGASLRPIVTVYWDADRNPVSPPHLLNLLEHPLVYIKELVSIDEPQSLG